MTGCCAAVVKELEIEGFRVVGARELLDRAASVPEGPLGGLAPDAEAEADIARGIEAARALGALDIGQAVVVQQGLVLGVEAIEGTDALLRRCAALAPRGPGRRAGEDREARPGRGAPTCRRSAPHGRGRRPRPGCAASPSRPARR